MAGTLRTALCVCVCKCSICLGAWLTHNYYVDAHTQARTSTQAPQLADRQTIATAHLCMCVCVRVRLPVYVYYIAA